MKRNFYSLTKSVIITALLVLMVSFFSSAAYAETVKQETKITTTSTVTTDNTSDTQNTSQIEQKTESIWNSVRVWGISVYEKVDIWRVGQLGVWRDIKTEKELQINSLEQSVEENRDERVEKTLTGEQSTMFTGASEDFSGTGNSFLLKLYVVAINIFVFIFSTQIIFYGIILLVILSILNKIIQKIRNPHSF